MRDVDTAPEEKVRSIAENVARVKARMEQAARRAGREPSDVRLVAASKMVDSARLRAALGSGVRILGENYLQEARQKIGQLGAHAAEWHCIGALQRNKVRYIFDLFSMVHAVDRLELADDINRRGERLGRHMSVLLEVNLGGETTKSGFTPQALMDEIGQLATMSHLHVCGLMTIPPPAPIPEAARPFFQELRELRDRLVQRGVEGLTLHELSMGMTADFEVAIEEGATLVRVGTAIFGPRPATQHA